MDFILFFIGLYALLRNRTHSVITCIILLSSRYLQLPIKSPFFVNFIFPHNVEDLGLVLYMMWFTMYYFKGLTSSSHPIIKYTNFFWFFLIMSGCYDIYIGVPAVDVIKYLRQWILLTVVYVAPNIPFQTIIRSLKQITIITTITCVYILFTNITGIALIEMRTLEGRGVKPPSYAMICAVLCFANPWNWSKLKKYTYLLLLLAPVIVNMKATYAVTIVGAISLFVMISSKTKTINKIVMLTAISLMSIGVLSFSNEFADRMSEMIENVTSQSLSNISSEDNFTYRIAHSVERLGYILTKNNATRIRGLGFITDDHYKEDAFVIGLWNKEKKEITQLDTGDIAWSLLFLRLGIVGLIIYLSFYIKLASLLLKNRKRNTLYGAYASILVVFLLFTSLGNTIITNGEFFFIPLLVTSYNKLIYGNNSSSYLVI